MNRMQPMPVPAFRQRTPKSSERLARHLANAIVDGSYAEGARLPHESDMLAQLQVGRATLREALRLLEVWGLVVIRTGPGGGPTVRRPREGEFTEQLAMMLHFQQLSLADVSDARIALEPMMARLAAERIKPEQLEVLRETIRIMSEHRDDNLVEFWRQNERFHSGVAEAADSHIISMVANALGAIGDGSSSGVAYSPRQLEDVIQAHTRVLEGIEKGDPDAAAEAMQVHLVAGRKFIGRRYPGTLNARIVWPE
ncbi:DNA-binding transcriptional regulator, FadR family [Nakamurella panacisegetis]|uniref:DNA-binding transcriptional regulator, FadR family n=2 Tax=Nakamurella panacisegetis TaxID=1090615 RepID=A0A1H0LBW9_9ACTN|nr:DNA-binding transcriptional regulator, FadR family [Nakamurella panacisegetis]